MAVHVAAGSPGPNDVPGDPSPAQQPSPSVSAVSVANTAVSITYAAVAGQRHRLTFLGYSYSAAPTAGRVTVTDGATTIFDIDVTSSWEVLANLLPGGILGTANSAMVITLSAGGVGIVGKLVTAKLTA